MSDAYAPAALPGVASMASRIRGLARLAAMGLSAVTVIGFAPLAAFAAWTPSRELPPLRLPIALPTLPTANDAARSEADETPWLSWTVGRGDTASALFLRAGLDRAELHRILGSGRHGRRLATLQPRTEDPLSPARGRAPGRARVRA
ncbi:MAG: hypothetical protein RML12_01595 [Xanthomonadales bacterium]|nr:hypothetical protein [Xanthomonadales bacterium]